jgi:uncharacterized membrane protein YqjE
MTPWTKINAQLPEIDIMASPENGATLQRLVMEVARNAGDLVQRELALFKSELKSSIFGLMGAVVMVLAGIVFAMTGLALLACALVEYLALILDNRALANLFVGFAALLIALVLFFITKRKMSLDQMAPRRSLRSLERDRDVIARRVHG